MAHDHGHSHGEHAHAHHARDYDLMFGLGIALNFGFVIAEASFGALAHSLALLADAGHNLSDVLALLVAWGAARLSLSRPTERRTYGMRRTSILATLFNALVLLVVVGGIAWEAVGRLFTPLEVAGGTVIWVAAAGVVINGATALLFLRDRKSDVNIKGAYLHMVGDAAVSLGVLISGIAILHTGWNWLDPAASLVASALIVWSTWGLLKETLSLALDAVPAGIDPQAVNAFLASLAGVTAVHDLHIWAMSTTEVALTAHLVMPEPPASDRFIGELCRALHERYRIGHVTVQVERGDPGVICRQGSGSAV